MLAQTGMLSPLNNQAKRGPFMKATVKPVIANTTSITTTCQVFPTFQRCLSLLIQLIFSNRT